MIPNKVLPDLNRRLLKPCVEAVRLILDLKVTIAAVHVAAESQSDEYVRPLPLEYIVLDFLKANAPILMGPLIKLFSLWPKANPPPIIQARDINVTINVQVMQRPDH